MVVDDEEGRREYVVGFMLSKLHKLAALGFPSTIIWWTEEGHSKAPLFMILRGENLGLLC